ncbi:alpha-ketoglutarate-dependent dioxygenase AlkB [Kitasatospora sp. NPDC085879]|jgi:alkylated DNA repair dioxygenase AlkB|uniref:alpha-ketoglutarate-dependent dioxygenase AlkB n=1 Tax=Kitasatospora sp. NPDC085879 TaxID=3154769 RepID=UPI000BB13827|nr:alpha-ketoglutarate-dependent dioxygenase AlkB [Streptomyces sp. TLI_235]PBC76118.1 DNA-N1-methyladenine dioxygenase [Streptomyces sp. TLI_235]
MLQLQGSLFDDTEEIGTGPLDAVRRTVLGDGAWIDEQPGWLRGAGALFERLAADVPWQAERRTMYERVVDVPRLLAFYGEDDFAGGPEALPHPVLAAARTALGAHYARELGEPFATAGLCYYRDGRDSVAWHGDRLGRGGRQDTMIAIVSVGEPRPLLLRPRGGGPAVKRLLGHGDLLVMGGSCQRTWEHAVPKTARPVGPRISIQYRPRGVR